MKHFKQFTLGLAAATALVLTGCADSGDQAAADKETAAPQEQPAVAKLAVIEHPTAEQLVGTKPYPLETCSVSGESLGDMGDPILILVGNQQFKLCCKSCLPDIKKDPAKWIAQLEK